MVGTWWADQDCLLQVQWIWEGALAIRRKSCERVYARNLHNPGAGCRGNGVGALWSRDLAFAFYRPRGRPIARITITFCSWSGRKDT